MLPLKRYQGLFDCSHFITEIRKLSLLLILQTQAAVIFLWSRRQSVAGSVTYSFFKHSSMTRIFSGSFQYHLAQRKRENLHLFLESRWAQRQHTELKVKHSATVSWPATFMSNHINFNIPLTFPGKTALHTHGSLCNPSCLRDPQMFASGLEK